MKIKNEILAGFLRKRREHVERGRALSKEIDAITAEIEDLQKQEREITEGVKCEETIAKAEKLAKKIDKDIEKLEKFRAEEAEHRHTALENGAEQAPLYRLMSKVIKAGCQTAIKVSEKI